MRHSTQKKISITNLIVNIDNPRFDMVGNQQEAIEVMVKDQDKKILNLAKHIIEFGLNPSETPIVSPHEKKAHCFNVLEGNRRVVAIKLLHNPDIVKGNKIFYRQIKPLSHKFHQAPVSKIPCAVFSKADDAFEWIKLKHTGENDGIGTVRWDAQQTARFDERVSGKSAIALQAIDFLKKSEELDPKIKSNLSKLPSTNLDRLLRDKGMQELLGFRIEDGRLQTHLKPEELTKGLSKIAGDLISKKIKVKDIYTKEDREKYIETFQQNEIPNKSNKSASIWEVTAPGQKSLSGSQLAKRGMPSALMRKTIIPKDCILKIKEKRINNIYLELKKLDCEEFTNSASVLFRVFVELSIDAYLAAHRAEITRSKGNSLKSKVEDIANYFETKNILEEAKLKGIRAAVSNDHSILSIDSFNDYVHNRHLTPIAKDIKASWDNIQFFIQRIWE
jgi:hypothetical protein